MPKRTYIACRRALAVAVMAALTAAAFGMPAAARDTYVIHDGDSVIVHESASRDPAQALREAGVELSLRDRFTAQRAEDAQVVTVQRLQTIRVYADGESYTTYTYGSTVGEILRELGITLGQYDRVSYPLDQETRHEMCLMVTRVTSDITTAQQVLPAEERVFLNTVLQPGQETVLDPGADGLVTVSTKSTYENGRLVSQEAVSQAVAVPSRDRVVIRGAETAALPVDNGDNTITTAGGEVLRYSRAIDGKATAYNCPGYVGHTASGTIAEVGKVAVDPRVIPLGSKLYVVTQDGQYVYGYCVAEDTGGLIKGNKVDLYFATWDECIQFGYRPVTIYVLEA